MYKLFIDEIINNKKIYLNLLLYISGFILLIVLLYKPFLSEYYEDIYFLINIPIFSAIFPMLIGYKSEKLMLINAKLPMSLSGLYFTRIIRILFIPAIGLIFLLITNIFDEKAFSFNTVLYILIYTCMVFLFILFQDMKVVTEKYKLIKKYSLIIIPIIILILIFVLIVYIIKTNHILHDNLGFRILSVILFYCVCIALSYQIFKLRKSYKS